MQTLPTSTSSNLLQDALQSLNWKKYHLRVSKKKNSKTSALSTATFD